jgi:hypothetical protein
MRFPARPEISLFIAKAMPALAHTQFSFQSEAYPGCKNDQDFGAVHLPLSVSEFQFSLLMLTAICLHGFALNYSQ